MTSSNEKDKHGIVSSGSGGLSSFDGDQRVTPSLEPQKPASAGKLQGELKKAAAAKAAEQAAQPKIQPKEQSMAGAKGNTPKMTLGEAMAAAKATLKQAIATPPQQREMTPEKKTAILNEKEREKQLAEKAQQRKKANPPPNFSFSSQEDEGKREKSENSEQQQQLPLHPVVDIPLAMAMAFIVVPEARVDAPQNMARLEIAELMVQNTWLEVNTLYDLRRRVQLLVSALVINERELRRPGAVEVKNIQQELVTGLEKLEKYLGKNPAAIYADILTIVQSFGEITSVITQLNSKIIHYGEMVERRKKHFRRGVLVLPKENLHSEDLIEGLAFLLAHVHYTPFSSQVDLEMYEDAQKNAPEGIVARLAASITQAPFKAIQHPHEQISPPIAWGTTAVDSHISSVHSRAWSWLQGLPTAWEIERRYQQYSGLFNALGQKPPTIETFPMDLSTLLFRKDSEHGRTSREPKTVEIETDKLADFYLYTFPYLVHQLFPADSLRREITTNSPPSASDFISWFVKRGALLVYNEPLPEAVDSDFDFIRTKLFERAPASKIIVKLQEVLTFFTNSEKQGDLFSSRGNWLSKEEFDQKEYVQYPNLHRAIAGLEDSDFESWQQQLDPTASSVLDHLVVALLERGWVEKQNPDSNTLSFVSTAPTHITLEQLAEACGVEDAEAIARFCEFFKKALTKSYPPIQSAYLSQETLHEVVPAVYPQKDLKKEETGFERLRLNCAPLLGDLSGSPFMAGGRVPNTGFKDGETINLTSLSSFEELFPLVGKELERVRYHFELLERGERHAGYISRDSSRQETQNKMSDQRLPSAEQIRGKIEDLEENVRYYELLLESDMGSNSSDWRIKSRDENRALLMQWQKILEENDKNRLTSPEFMISGLLEKWVRPLISSYMLYLFSAQDVIIPDRTDKKGSGYVRDLKTGGWKLATTAKSVAMALLEEKLDEIDLLEKPKWGVVEPILLEVGSILDTYNQELVDFENYENQEDVAEETNPLGAIEDSRHTGAAAILDRDGSQISGIYNSDSKSFAGAQLLQSGLASDELLAPVYMEQPNGESIEVYHSYQETVQNLPDRELLRAYELHKHFFSFSFQASWRIKCLFAGLKNSENPFEQLHPSGKERLVLLKNELRRREKL